MLKKYWREIVLVLILVIPALLFWSRIEELRAVAWIAIGIDVVIYGVATAWAWHRSPKNGNPRIFLAALLVVAILFVWVFVAIAVKAPPRLTPSDLVIAVGAYFGVFAFLSLFRRLGKLE